MCRDKANVRAEKSRVEKAILYDFATAATFEPCSDGNCMLGHPGGMHTNGGCRCGRYLEGGAQGIWLARSRRMLALMAEEIRELRAKGGNAGSAAREGEESR